MLTPQLEIKRLIMLRRNRRSCSGSAGDLDDRLLMPGGGQEDPGTHDPEPAPRPLRTQWPTPRGSHVDAVAAAHRDHCRDSSSHAAEAPRRRCSVAKAITRRMVQAACGQRSIRHVSCEAVVQPALAARRACAEPDLVHMPSGAACERLARRLRSAGWCMQTVIVRACHGGALSLSAER